MANLQQIVRDYVLTARTVGVDEAIAKTQRLGATTDQAATKTENYSRSNISAAAALERHQRSLDVNYRSMKQFEGVQRDLDKARSQGLLTTDRYNQLIGLAAERHDQLSKGQKAAAVAVQDLNARLSASMGPLGSLGQILGTIGPAGIAIGVGLGAAIIALKAMSDAAHQLAEKAQELRRFSEITGLTTAQVQALRSEASKFGVTSDEAQTSIQQFTARFNELRLGSGELLTQIRRINPALADQMAMTTNAGDALTLFGQALQNVDNIFQRNALVKAAAGRGGLSVAAFFSGLDVGKVTQAFEDAGKGLDRNLIHKLAQLEIDIKKTSAKAQQNIASIFAEDVLEAQKRWAEQWLKVTEAAKNFTLSDDLKTFIQGSNVVPGWWKTLVEMLPLMRQFMTFGVAKVNEPATHTVVAAPTIPVQKSPLGAPEGATPEYQVAKLKEYIAALGQVAPLELQRRATLDEMAIALKNAGKSTEEIARAQGTLRGEYAKEDLRTRVGILGDLATAQEVAKAKQNEINDANKRGAKISEEQAAVILLRTERQRELNTVEGQIKFDRQTLFLSDTDRQIAQLLAKDFKTVEAALNSSDAADMRLNARLKQSKDLATDFTQSLLTGLLEGKNGMDVLIASAGQLGQAMMQIGTKSIANSLTGGMKGLFDNKGMAGFSFDPASMAMAGIGALISLWAGNEQKKKAEMEAQQRAWEQWQAAAFQVESYFAKTQGVNRGSIKQALAPIRDAANDNKPERAKDDRDELPAAAAA
jgi:hypothetical protein